MKDIKELLTCRVSISVLVLLFALPVFAKKETAGRLSATCVIREHQTGANMVEITVLEPFYPPGLLKSQVQKMSEYLDSSPRGLQVYHHQLSSSQPKLRFLKATFAIDGLIREDKQTFRLEPILKAFAGASDPYTLRLISLHFSEKKPGPKTLKFFSSKALEIKGNVHAGPEGIEYLIEYRSQNPDEIKVPEEVLPLNQIKNHSSQTKNSWKVFEILGLIGACLVLGVGIYFMLTKYILRHR